MYDNFKCPYEKSLETYIYPTHGHLLSLETYRMHLVYQHSWFIQQWHAGHCWRSRDELISDLLLWTPTHGRAKAGRPARTYIQQLCEDTGCCPEDLPEAMNDREKWGERVRDICATSTTWSSWWWWWFI